VSEAGILSAVFTIELQGVPPANISVIKFVFDALFCEHELILMQHINTIKKQLTNFIKSVLTNLKGSIIINQKITHKA
jgi:hypothetical protein